MIDVIIHVMSEQHKNALRLYRESSKATIKEKDPNSRIDQPGALLENKNYPRVDIGGVVVGIPSVSQNENVCMMQLTPSGLFCLLCTMYLQDVTQHLSGSIHNTNLRIQLKMDAVRTYNSFWIHQNLE